MGGLRVLTPHQGHAECAGEKGTGTLRSSGVALCRPRPTRTGAHTSGRGNIHGMTGQQPHPRPQVMEARQSDVTTDAEVEYNGP